METRGKERELRVLISPNGSNDLLRRMRVERNRNTYKKAALVTQLFLLIYMYGLSDYLLGYSFTILLKLD